MNQRNTILNYLKEGNYISSIHASIEFGITQLSARLVELEQAGHVINREWRTSRGKRFKVYFLPVEALNGK